MKEEGFSKAQELEGVSRFVFVRGKFTKGAGGLGAGMPEPFLCQSVQMQELHPCCGEPLPGQGCPKQAYGKYTASYGAATQLGFAWVIPECLSLHNRTEGKTGAGQGNSHTLKKPQQNRGWKDRKRGEGAGINCQPLIPGFHKGISPL